MEYEELQAAYDASVVKVHQEGATQEDFDEFARLSQEFSEARTARKVARDQLAQAVEDAMAPVETIEGGSTVN